MLTTKEIQKAVAEAVAVIGEERSSHKVFSVATTPTHTGEPHVEIVGTEYHYVFTERGEEFERHATEHDDEIIYWFVSSYVFMVAGNWELKNREPGQDSRRRIFGKEVELLKRVSDKWANRKEDEISRILEKHPYAN
ncbi:MAG: hypothetical protein GKR90_27400 [Pseudomonadales bacterium]|nr:hypothetical protein [Pseudomonadales bacterium]